jgi:hypothetical protein
MGVTTLQINLKSEQMEALRKIRADRKIPSDKNVVGYKSDDSLARMLCVERMDELQKLSQLVH